MPIGNDQIEPPVEIDVAVDGAKAQAVDARCTQARAMGFKLESQLPLVHVKNVRSELKIGYKQ